LIRLKYQLNKIKWKNPNKTFSEKEVSTLPYITASSFEKYTYDNYVSIKEDIPIVEKEDTIILWDWARAGFIEQWHYWFLSSTMVLLRINSKYNKKFFYYYLKSNQKLFRDFANWTTIPHADWELLDNFYIPNISISTQTTIANYLDGKTDQISTFIAKKQQLISCLQEQKKAIIHKAVTKGIEEWVNMKDSGINWIGKIPSEWKVSKLKFVFRYITWATPDNGKNGYYWWDNNWITISDLNWKYTWESKNKITDLAVKEKNMKIVPKWSLLYSFKLSVWQLAFVSQDTYTNEAIFAILEKEWLNLDFWYYALGSYFINNANENIYWAKIFNQFYIDNWFVVVPSFETQNTIVKYLEQYTSKIDETIAIIEQQINYIEEYRTSLIYHAVTGKLVAV